MVGSFLKLLVQYCRVEVKLTKIYCLTAVLSVIFRTVISIIVKYKFFYHCFNVRVTAIFVITILYDVSK